MKTIELTDEIRQDEPVGYLVFRADKTIQEYDLYIDDIAAERAAENQREKKIELNEYNGSSEIVGDWDVYPLWAGIPENM